MATHLDLQEQEQLEELKAFWNQYGNLVTWVVVVALAALAAWTFWQRHQHDQAVEAAVLFHEMDVAQQADDVKKASQVMADMTHKYGRTEYAAQAALIAAKMQQEHQETDAARASLQWVLDHSDDPSYQAVARLRLAGLLIEQHQLDAAKAMLEATWKPGFKALADDRRGDILQLQNRPQEAIAAYREAWSALGDDVQYRQLIAAKLAALGAAPQTGASAPAAASASASEAVQP
jgi:predicted negative regulator of RcsB-dependent stress response